MLAEIGLVLLGGLVVRFWWKAGDLQEKMTQVSTRLVEVEKEEKSQRKLKEDYRQGLELEANRRLEEVLALENVAMKLNKTIRHLESELEKERAKRW